MTAGVITTELSASGRAGRLSELRERLMAPVDAAGLAVLRAGIGGLIAWEVWREIDNGFVRADYADPRYLFRWSLFEWVKPVPDTWLFAVFVLLALSGLFVAVGLYYRTAAIVMSAGMAYWFLLEKVRYLNHHYLAGLFAVLLVVVPAHAVWSMDAQRKPWVRSDTVPAWTVWLLRFQVGVPYFFAGVAKLNFDWLGRGEPLGMWLERQTDFPVIGALFTSEPFVRVLALGSTALDLSVPFLLLHRRTRAPAYGAALAFHFMNSRLFNIGMFPWMMILATTVFFDADWPRRIVRAVREGSTMVRAAILAACTVGFVLGGFLPRTFSGVRAVIGGIGVAVLAFGTSQSPAMPTGRKRATASHGTCCSTTRRGRHGSRSRARRSCRWSS
jgi:vitamin K-dependent gamma-carboxylase